MAVVESIAGLLRPSFRRRPEPSPLVCTNHWIGLDSARTSARSILSPSKGQNDDVVERKNDKTLELERISSRKALETPVNIGYFMKYAGWHIP